MSGSHPDGARPRVLHVIVGLRQGGAEASLVGLVTRDIAHEHVVLSLTDAGHHGPALAARGIEVRCLGLEPGRLGSALSRGLGLGEIRRQVRSLTPVVVQTWMYHADLLGGLGARAAGHRAVCWNVRLSSVHRGGYGRGVRALSRALAVLSRTVPARIVCCARSAARDHVTLGYPAERVRVVPNGYDLDRFAPDAGAGRALRERHGIGADTRLLGALGRWNPVKNYPGLLDALAALAADGPAWTCLLAGGGLDVDNAELVAGIRRRGLQGRVVPVGPLSDPVPFCAGLDAHVLCSLDEGFPNVVAETLACGTPGLVTDVGDAADIVGDTGWVVPAGDTAALAAGLEAMLAALVDVDGARARRERCRERAVRRFGIDAMVDAYAAVWSEAVAASAGGHRAAHGGGAGRGHRT